MKNNSKTIALILLLLLLGSVGYNFIQQRQLSETKVTDEIVIDSLIQTRVNLTNELEQASLELMVYKGFSSRGDSLLVDATDRIARKEEKIKQLIASEKNLEKLNKLLKTELEELKKLRDENLETIEKLMSENKQLKTENTALNNSLQIVMEQNMDYYKTIKTAEVLKTGNLNTLTFKRKNNDKYVETMIAKRTNKVDVCFDIVENKISKPGKRNVYLRIIAPDGMPLGNRSSGSGSFKNPSTNEDVLYTSVEEIDYLNSTTPICMSYEEGERIYAPGTYIIEVYIEGYPAGASSFNLK